MNHLKRFSASIVAGLVLSIAPLAVLASCPEYFVQNGWVCVRTGYVNDGDGVEICSYGCSCPAGVRCGAAPEGPPEA